MLFNTPTSWIHPLGLQKRTRKQLVLHVVERHVVAQEIIALKEWLQKRLELFVKRVYKQERLDNRTVNDEALTKRAYAPCAIF